MPEETTYFQRAPIVEAIVGIDLEEMLGEDVLTTLKAFGEQLGPEYNLDKPIVMGQVRFELGSGLQPKQEDIELGYFFKAGDRLQVVQVRRNGFGFSRLAPYQNWPLFISEARRIWELYRQAVGPSKLSKWTVRYINKLSWPEGEKIEHYLRVYPHIPENLPQTIQGLFMRLQVPIPLPQGMLTQQLVQVPSEQDGKVSFILDNEFNFGAAGLDDFETWEQIQSFRDTKNLFFVNSITEKTKEMIA